MKRPLIALATIATGLTAVPAAAESITIDHRDLNLATVEGQEVLERRIDNAAREVCGYDEQYTGSRFRPVSVERCYEQAKASASEQYAAVVSENRLGG